MIRKIAGLVSMFLLAVMLVPLNLLQVLSLVIFPISPKLFRFVNRSVCAMFFGSLSFFLQSICGVEIRASGDRLPDEDNAFVISNHQAMADIPVIVAIARRSKRAGDVKWFVKDPIKYVPGIGWGMLFLDCIYVKRNWTADRERVEKTFESIRAHRTSFWLVSFLEGTRLRPAKKERSQVYARKAGLPHLEHVMLPRTKGFEATMEGLGDHKQAVYDFTIGYEGHAPGLGELFLGPVKRIHVHVKRHAVGTIPASKAARGQWVIDRWIEKDQLLETFQREGAFPA